MANARLTLIGLYNYDESLFVNLSVPELLNKQDVIDNILLRCGEMPVLYPNFSICKTMIGTWSRKWYHGIERMIQTLDDDYNPLHNYDRYEKIDDERHNTNNDRTDSELNRTTSQNKTDTTTFNSTIADDTSVTDDLTYQGSDTTINDISAFNDSNYQPSSKNSLTSANSSDRDYSEDKTSKHTGTDELKTIDAQTLKDVNGESKNSKFDENSKHDGHLYGNIGTTTSQSMVLDELSLRSTKNIYDIIAEIFMRDFCIYVY